MTQNPDKLAIELIAQIPHVPSAIDILGQAIKELEGTDTCFECTVQKVGHETRVGFFIVDDTKVRELLERTRAYIRFTIDSNENRAVEAYITNRIFTEAGLFINGSETYKSVDMPLEYYSDKDAELGDVHKDLFVETIKRRM